MVEMPVRQALVIGLFNHDTDADGALNNLAEADIPANSISIATNDYARAAALTSTPGPWATLSPDQVAARLQSIGVALHDAASYAVGIRAGSVFIAVRTAATTSAAVQELLV